MQTSEPGRGDVSGGQLGQVDVSRGSLHPVSRALLLSAACIIIVAGMKQAETILVPFFLSIFIAIIFGPLVVWLKQRGMATSLALVVVVCGLVFVIVGVLAVVGGSVADFTSNSEQYEVRLNEEMDNVFRWLEGMGVDSEPLRQQTLLDTEQAVGLLTTLLSGLGSALSNGFLVVLTSIFMLLEVSSLHVKIRAISGDRSKAEERLNAIVADIRRYLATKTLVSFGTGILIGATLFFIGVDYPVLWGLLAFMFNFVPNIGSIIASIPPVILAFLQFGFWRAAFVAMVFLAVNMVIGNLIEPRMMGKRLGLSTLVVFLSLVFWGWVLGPIGMLLSVPLTMAAKIILERYDETRWVGLLLGSESAARVALETSPIVRADD